MIKRAIPASSMSVEGRYANALFSAATKQRATSQVSADLPQLQKIFRSGNTSLIPQLHPLSRNFIKLLAENNRISYADKIISAYSTLADSSATTVVVTSAQVLSLLFASSLIHCLFIQLITVCIASHIL